MLFLSETKLDEKGMKRFKRILEMGDMVVVDSVGRGIAVLWRRRVDVSLRSKLELHIDVDISRQMEGRGVLLVFLGSPIVIKSFARGRC